MRLLSFLLNPAIIAIAALFLSVVWMLRNQKDKTRPLLVLALTLNVFFGFLLTVVMGQEDGMLPWKYDRILFALDAALGIHSDAIARPLQDFLRIPLIVVYQLMVPMMICWFLVTTYRNMRGSVVLAYVGELVAGPLLYAVLPGCGPAYAFGAQWLNPPHVEPIAIKLAAMPNAFPSLHMATALVFVFFAPGKAWRAVALAFLCCTALATLSTGEHYIIDLFAGLIFGCFAASVGFRRVRSACLYLGAVLAWSLSVRFGFAFLIAHPWLVRLMAALAFAVAVRAVASQWRTPVSQALENAAERPGLAALDPS